MDNDKIGLGPHVDRLTIAGYQVVRAYTVSEAERLLRDNESWDLVIIDPMMDVKEEEEANYPPSSTDNGLKAGLVFFERNRERIAAVGAQAIVFTMRGDQEIISNFVASGVRRKAIRNKMDAADGRDFLLWIEDVIGERK
jgi:hypothetical protein